MRKIAVLIIIALIAVLIAVLIAILSKGLVEQASNYIPNSSR